MEKALRKALGARIRALRKGSGLTIAQLAELSGMDGGFLAYIELGQKTPSLATLAKIAAGLRVPLRGLFGDEPMKRSGEDHAVLQKLRALTCGFSPAERQSFLSVLSSLHSAYRGQAFLEFRILENG